MSPSKHNTGMRGVFLVAAELSKRGYIVSPTSRSAFGADLLVTDDKCKKAFSVQVKTNTRIFNFWLLNKHSKELNSISHIYVFVNLRKDGNETEFFIVPSKIVSKKMYVEEKEKSSWYSFSYHDAVPYKDKWQLFDEVLALQIITYRNELVTNLVTYTVQKTLGY